MRNVLVIVALRQKDSLREFNSENYVQIVKCAKDLPNSHVFGVSATPTHSFTKIMQNHY